MDETFIHQLVGAGQHLESAKKGIGDLIDEHKPGCEGCYYMDRLQMVFFYLFLAEAFIHGDVELVAGCDAENNEESFHNTRQKLITHMAQVQKEVSEDPETPEGAKETEQIVRVLKDIQNGWARN